MAAMRGGDLDKSILDPNGAHERLAQWKGRIDKLAADTQAMSDRLKEVQVSASDSTGLVEVTIDSTGALVDLRLTERIQRVSPDVVARTIMAALGEARSKLADRTQEIIAETVGTESATGRAIVDSVRRQLHGDPAPAGAVEPEDDDGYDSRSYLGRR